MRSFSKMSDDQRDEIDRLSGLVTTWTSKIRREFLAAIRRVADRIDVDHVADLLRQGRAAQALDVVNTALVAEEMAPVAATVTDAVIEAGKDAAAIINEVPALSGGQFVFGITNPATITQLQTYEFGQVKQIADSARKQVAEVIRAGVADGQNPRDTARDVKQFIGLTDRQTRAVLNFRRALSESPGDALLRQLRDKRFDGTVNRAAANGKPLSGEQIDRMVDRYRERYLKFRAETIARTEAIRAVNFGNVTSWRQAIEGGKLAGAAVIKRWIYTPDERTRHAHRTIPFLNPDDVGLDDKFKSELGPIAYPGDPDAVPANVIQCRCALVIRYKGNYG